MALINGIAIFPLFFIFILTKIIQEKEESDLEFIEYILSEIEKAKNNAIYYSIALIVFLTGIYLWSDLGFSGVSWRQGDPFTYDHAVGFSAAACIFIGVTIPVFSVKSKSLNEKAP